NIAKWKRLRGSFRASRKPTTPTARPISKCHPSSGLRCCYGCDGARSRKAMSLPKDWKEFLVLLNSRGAEYVVVGAFALAFHSEPRFTGDLDLLIRRTPENANRIIEALHEFGFASLGITCEDLLLEGNVIQLGIQPN